ncbi:hypothetical protein GJ496_011987 [Pomphorhynchus laevis]|nr:hypothetical protein GJ496_011987 [Pomphorhynchus laevis]
MEYFDKLKIVGDNVKNVLVKGMVDTVFTVQSSVRDVLPGNPLTREYEIIKEVGLAGPGNAWHIFSTVKKSTKEPGSMFLLEKRLWSKFNKHTKDELIELFRNGVQQLTRLKHPRLLAIQHQLEESRDSIAFITEPVSCSLADCLRHSGGSHNFSDIEIRYGIMQICNALKFLHDDGKILHGNICPESILISEQSGLWKLGCFEHFLQGTLHPGNTKPSFTRKEFNFNAAEYSNPNLNYMAMEYVDGSVSPSEFSDMFSVGSLIFTLYNNGNTLLSCNSTNLRDLRRSLKTIRTATRIKSDVPKIVKKAIELLLSPDHSSRPNANNFLKSTFFVDEMALKALDYIDCLFQVDNLQRSMFYKSLLPLIPSLPSKIKLLRLMSAFELEFINCDIMPYVMPNIFVIANECNESEFDKYMLPKLKIVFRQTLNIQV